MTANKRKAYSVVSYFCGCGGLDLGFRGGFKYHNEDYPALSFDIVEAYDNEPRCIETYNDYFGANHAFVKDLAAAKPDERQTYLSVDFHVKSFLHAGLLVV